MSVASVAIVASAVVVPCAPNRATPSPERRDEQRSPDDPVARDHHRREHRVARERRRVRAAGHHQRHDQPDLDDGHRDREEQRAERLAHPVGDDLGVMDRRQDRAREHDGHEHEHDRSRLRPPRGREQHRGEERDRRGPGHSPQPSHGRTAPLRARPEQGVERIVRACAGQAGDDVFCEAAHLGLGMPGVGGEGRLPHGRSHDPRPVADGDGSQPAVVQHGEVARAATDATGVQGPEALGDRGARELQRCPVVGESLGSVPQRYSPADIAATNTA